MALAVPLLDTTRARTELGWEPRIGADQALRELLDGMSSGNGAETPTCSGDERSVPLGRTPHTRGRLHVAGHVRRRRSGDEERLTVFLYLAQGKASAVPRKLLAVYLNDHLAGATLGLELVRRTARENRDSTLGSFLADVLLPEIEEDRRTLQRLMGQIRIAPSRPKVAAAWLAEKLGRLKLNGELRRYSPLSRLVELEGLAVGIEGKRSLWLALEAASDGGLNGFDFPALAERAAFQRSRLEEHRLAAVRAALGKPSASALDTGA